MEDKSVNNTVVKSNKLGKIFVFAGIFLIIILSGLSYAGYTYLYIPSKVSDSLNKNIDKHNQTLKKSEDLLAEFKTNSSKLSPSETSYYTDLKSIVDSLKNSIKTINSDIDSTNNSLDKGINQDTEEFSKLVSDNLSATKVVLASVQESMDYYLCFAEKNQGTNSINSNLGTQILNFSPNKSKEEFLSTSKTVQESFQKLSNSFSSYGECFTGQFAIYKDQEYNDAVLELTKYLDSYIQSYKLLDKYVESQNSADLATANSNLDLLKTQKPKLFDENYIDKILQYGETEVKSQSQKLADYRTKANDRLDLISKKYNLASK